MGTVTDCSLITQSWNRVLETRSVSTPGTPQVEMMDANVADGRAWKEEGRGRDRSLK